MTAYRVDHDVAELAIGHQRQGLDRLYNFAELWELRRDAFAKVSDHVAALIEPGKVVALAPVKPVAPAEGMTTRVMYRALANLGRYNRHFISILHHNTP
jgi:hypothetical protein